VVRPAGVVVAAHVYLFQESRGLLRPLPMAATRWCGTGAASRRALTRSTWPLGWPRAIARA
jgi:hypothetical protein